MDSWEESQSKSKYRFLILPVVLLAVAGGIVVVNNSNFLSSGDKNKVVKKEQKKEENIKVEKISATEDIDSAENSGDRLNEKIDRSVSITRIRCKLKEPSAGEISISLRLFCKDITAKDELLYKRDEIKITVQKIMMRKMLEEINVEDLRNELKDEINKSLGSDILEDIEFTDFRPVQLL